MIVGLTWKRHGFRFLLFGHRARGGPDLFSAALASCKALARSVASWAAKVLVASGTDGFGTAQAGVDGPMDAVVAAGSANTGPVSRPHATKFSVTVKVSAKPSAGAMPSPVIAGNSPQRAWCRNRRE